MCFGLVAYYRMCKSPLNQRYGDVWGKTAVVKIKEAGLESQQKLSLRALGLTAGLVNCAILLAAGILLKMLG
jgi:hypothetical protein